MHSLQKCQVESRSNSGQHKSSATKMSASGANQLETQFAVRSPASSRLSGEIQSSKHVKSIFRAAAIPIAGGSRARSSNPCPPHSDSHSSPRAETSEPKKARRFLAECVPGTGILDVLH